MSASNIYGTSIDSVEDNGAYILTVPDAPINLANVVDQTLATQIGLVWEDGISDGGTPIIDYIIWTDQATGVYMPLISGLTVREYLDTGLSVGSYYSYKI